MLISQHINFSRLNNKQHKAQAARLCLGRHVCSAGLLPSGGEHHYAQVNETKGKKSIDSTFEKENTEDGSGQGDLSVPDGVWHSWLQKAEEKGSILSGPSPEQNPSRLTEVDRFRFFFFFWIALLLVSIRFMGYFSAFYLHRSLPLDFIDHPHFPCSEAPVYISD